MLLLTHTYIQLIPDFSACGCMPFLVSFEYISTKYYHIPHTKCVITFLHRLCFKHIHVYCCKKQYMVTYVAVFKSRLYGFGCLLPVQHGFLERKCLEKKQVRWMLQNRFYNFLPFLKRFYCNGKLLRILHSCTNVLSTSFIHSCSKHKSFFLPR